MVRRKKERGRPARPLPPRVDATAEEMARAMFALSPDHEWGYEKEDGKTYRCKDCEREVSYPDTLYRDGRCEDCRNTPAN